jgi:uncharacterized protein (DUF1810 family)
VVAHFQLFGLGRHSIRSSEDKKAYTARLLLGMRYPKIMAALQNLERVEVSCVFSPSMPAKCCGR